MRMNLMVTSGLIVLSLSNGVLKRPSPPRWRLAPRQQKRWIKISRQELRALLRVDDSRMGRKLGEEATTTSFAVKETTVGKEEGTSSRF
ncbi:hypothetical protein QVD17_37092 [Tagetes erecta]|uniref:Secreted protein n=1 Tax=Tagetes erecta TaxID=13708 RepID=A0AAD8JTF6_TARER|nr:hypothetical protein QVD17_37092 [Tagetes erecta]